MVRVSTYISYNFNAIMSVGWNMWLDNMLLFLRLIAKMGDLILEGGINIKFYAKL